MRIDPVHTGFLNSQAMRIVCANGYATTLCDIMTYIDALAILAILLLFSFARMCLKHERDRRRRENIWLRRYALSRISPAVPCFNIMQPHG